MVSFARLVLELSWISLNLAVLVGFTCLVLAYLHSRPVVLMSIVDLLNADLLLTYCALFVTSGTIHITISLNLLLSIPTTFAVLMSFFICLWSACFFIYLVAGVVAHFILVHKRMTSISDTVTDEKLRNAVRIFVGCFSVAILITPGLLLGPERVYPLYYAMINQPERETATYSVGIAICLILGAIALTVNIVLRVLIRRARVDDDGATTTQLPVLLDTGEAGAPPPPYLAYVLVSLSLFLLGSLSALPADRFAHDFKRFVVLFVFCTLVPMAVITRDRKLRSYVLSRVLPLDLKSLVNRIGPV